MNMNEHAANVIENMALRIAEKNGGRISPNHLIPFLPISLELIDECLENIADQSVIYRERKDGLLEYEFSSYLDRPESEPTLEGIRGCVGCSSGEVSDNHALLCEGCLQGLLAELSRLAEKTGWPAQAVYEHEILFIASQQHENRLKAESLASRSRYTLKEMKKRLSRLVSSGYVRAELDETKGSLLYYFPEIEYEEKFYQRNRGIINQYPAAVMEELQTKISQIFVALAGLLLFFFAVGWVGIPFPIRVLGFIISAPIVGLMIWRYKRKPKEKA